MTPTPTADDPRLLQAVQAYLAELEAGRRPDRQELARQHPDLIEAMAPYLDALDLVHAATPMLQSSRPAAAELAEPLGDFRIVREIGRGGMGVVYEAIQLSLGRRVALKVLPFAAALDGKQLQRFKNEAQAAAHLHHQHIVPVYAVGSERGVHFYAMQLIEGQNLAGLLEELRRQEPQTSSRPAMGEATLAYPTPLLPTVTPSASTGLGAQLTTQRAGRAADFFGAIARLAAQAAEGLDYAHGLGIIHRDIKPANLLVDGRGNLWITDFGLAQFHADAGLTQTGDLLGTLRYMSPEQAGGQRVLIDQRTDVYSLGATLYELLTLRPMFDGTDRQTLLRQILHEEPRPLRQFDRAIPAELETIVLKAVSKVPAERYASARDLADDLERYLRHEPIRARPPTLVQRGRKWLRRHPSVLVAAALLLVLLAAGSAVAAWLIQAEQDKTRLAYERERQRAVEADERFRLARRVVDDMIQLSEEELANRPHQENLRKRILESALVYYQEFIDQRRDDPAAQEELRDTKARVEKILADLAVLQGAWQLHLLNHTAVLDDLGLDENQRQQMAELTREMDQRRMASFSEFHKLTPEERGQRFVELARANDEAVRQVLTAEQVARLRQIALQLQGPGAFRDASVAAALKLTPAQRERIRGVEADIFFIKIDGGRPGQPPLPPMPPPRRLHEENQKAVARILALLTDEQKQRWNELIGNPYVGPAPPLFPPPGGPFGPSKGKFEFRQD